MLDAPSRESLNALTAAAQAIAPVTALGFARAMEAGRVSVVYSYAHGMGEFALAAGDLLAPLLPGGDSSAHADEALLHAHRARAAEAFLLDNHTRRVVSLPLSGVAPPARLWLGLAAREPLSPSALRGLEAVAADSGRVLMHRPTGDEQLARLSRLERAAELIPALLHVLDVREVIDRLSATAKLALPHDLLLLNLFSEDLSTFTVYARSDLGARLGVVCPNPYPASTLLAWTYSIVDDHTLHPLERDLPSTKLGARSSLRFPVRFDNRVIGGVAFVSLKPHAFSDVDVPVGKRLSDHVASAISHFTLARRLAEEAKRTEELRAGATKIAFVDELLATLDDGGDSADVFGRIATMAGKVLRHDAAALLLHEPGGDRARVVASRGCPGGFPDVMELPHDERQDEWAHAIVDDVTGRQGSFYAQLGILGLRSVLWVAIRFDGRFGGVLTFADRSPGAFSAAELPVARRLADRLALLLARGREQEASRRADEAAKRAATLEARVRALTEELDARTGYRRVIGESAVWRQVLTQAMRVASTATTVLLLGESGTGKEVIARFLHRASGRNAGPFVALNCAALPEQLLEAELFGYERGAFTGATQSKPGQLERAAGGTLFLDEVGEMSLHAQAKFLRVLQEREFQRLGGTRVLRADARIVAATNRDLPKAIANGQFRDDLFYRLNVFAIRLPPLRERSDDILPLTEAFLAEFAGAFATPPAGISKEARSKLLAYPWPGNIRELRNTLERAAILCDGGLITDDHLALPAAPPPSPPRPAVALHTPGGSPAIADVGGHDERGSRRVTDVQFGPDLPSVERSMIMQALENARFNKSKAAKVLGLTRHQLYIRMRRHGIAD